MTGDRDELLGKLSEELFEAIAAGEQITPSEWAARYGVGEADVRACQRGLEALGLSIGEEMVDGPPEIPRPELPDDFEVVDELGRGGMGVVYRARQRSLDRDVAIKVLRPGDLVFGDALRRFRAEARSLARLRHRHIVSVYESGETPEGLLWFAMDLVDGRTLADELKARGRMMPARATKIVRQVTSAIAHAHAQGIVHRDLKPHNVLIDGQGDAFVVDFGLARDASSAGANTMSGELLGTPTYMSPEQARGDAADIGEACDVWALGTLLYEMLAGRAPFAGKPLHETIRAILHDDPPSLRKGDKKVPHELELVCSQALQKRPEDRYAGALAFGEDIERFQDGRGVLVQGPSRMRRIGRVLKRRWRAVATIAAAVLVTLGAVAMWLPTLRRDAIVQEAKRLVEAGHPDAAIDSLREVLADTANNASDRKQLQYEFVRALNDRAGELLHEGDHAGALAVAAEALPIAARRTTNGGVVHVEEMEAEQLWQWELARACAIADRIRGPLVPRHLLEADLGSENVGRQLLARRTATMLGVDLAGMDDEQQLQILVANLRAQPDLVASGTSLQIPDFGWLQRVHQCWSAALEDRLAAFAADTDESPTARALAFHMWSRCVGLPTFYGLAAAGDADGNSPTVAEVCAAAGPVTAKWRTWREMPRDEALKARIDLIVDSMAAREQLLPLSDGALRTAASQWTGQDLATASEYRTWWQETRSQDFRLHLLKVLGLQDSPSVLAALDRSAVTDSKISGLWRQLAWLQIEGGLRIPEGHPNATSNSSKWRTACLEAANVIDERTLTARIALLRFDDGSPEPELVAQAARSARIGQRLRLDLRATIAESSWFSLRRPWEDEKQSGEQWRSPSLPAARTEPAGFGEVTTAAQGDVRFDRNGVRFRVQPGLSLRSSLPWSDRQTNDRGVQRVWAGSAAAIDRTRVHWDMGRRTTHFVTVFALHEEPAEGTEANLGWWHAAIASSFDEGIRPGARDLSRSHSADWLTASLWSTPDALPAMQSLDADGPRSTMQRLAMAMAGDDEQGIEWPSTTRAEARDFAVRVALGSPSDVHRGNAFDVLDDPWGPGFTPRECQTLTREAADRNVTLPAEVQALVADAATPGGLTDWLTRSFVWPFVVWTLFLIAVGTFSIVRPGGSRGPRAFVLAALAYLLMFVRMRIGDTVVTPSWVPIVLMTWILARGGQGRGWWRIAGLGLMVVAAIWGMASSLFGVQPPQISELYFVIAALVALHVPRDQLARLAKLAKAPATAAIPESPRRSGRAERSKERTGRRLFVTVLIGAFVIYAGLQVVSSYMSKELLRNAEVRFVDPDGNPIAGVSTFLQWTEPSPYLTGRSLPPSDENGYVDLTGVQQKTATLARFFLDVQLPGHDMDWVPLELETTITLPHVGSLTVQLVDERGEPWADPANVHSMVYVTFHGQRQSFDANGRATLPLVACGTLELHGRIQGSGLLSSRRVVDGPEFAGETAKVTIPVPADMPRITGTLKNPDGTPFTKESYFSWQGRSGSLGGFRFTPDSSGRFRFLMSNDPAGGTVELRERFGKPRKVRVPESDTPVFDIGTVEMPPN